MSKPSRAICLFLLVGSLGYAYNASYLVNGDGPDFEQAKNLLTLYSLNIGVFVLAVTLGIMRRASDSDAEYLGKKKSLFAFLVKWGIIYGIYSFVGQKMVNKVMDDDTAGFFIMKFFGIYGFGALLAIYYGGRYIIKTKSAKAQ
ncbi:conserved membrane protein of unknown function [Burkholderia multivorans]